MSVSLDERRVYSNSVLYGSTCTESGAPWRTRQTRSDKVLEMMLLPVPLARLA